MAEPEIIEPSKNTWADIVDKQSAKPGLRNDAHLQSALIEGLARVLNCDVDSASFAPQGDPCLIKKVKLPANVNEETTRQEWTTLLDVQKELVEKITPILKMHCSGLTLEIHTLPGESLASEWKSDAAKKPHHVNEPHIFLYGDQNNPNVATPEKVGQLLKDKQNILNIELKRAFVSPDQALGAGQS